MSFQDSSLAAVETLTHLSSSHESESEFYLSTSALIQSKLYHQLTVNILQFTSTPSNFHSNIDIDGDGETSNFLQLYSILSNLKSKLNPLMLVRIAWNVSSIDDTKDILTALIASEEIQAAPHAKLYAEAKFHLLQIHQHQHALKIATATATGSNDFPKTTATEIQAFLKENTVTLQELANSTESEVASVHSSYYETAMELYKIVGPAHLFYKHAIQFLHYSPLSTLTEEQIKVLARDLSLAALVGEGVYNLGEIVYENEVLLNSLEGGEEGYLVELMRGAAEGKILSLAVYKDKLTQNGCDLRVIEEKIMLLALIHMVFEKESGERSLKFGEIAKRLDVALEQVEWVVMKALSLGLIKGSMDQVEGVVEVTWVMPRVLDASGVQSLSERFGEWSDNVKDTKGYIAEHVPAF